MSQTVEILVGECSFYWNYLVQSSFSFGVGTASPHLFFSTTSVDIGTIFRKINHEVNEYFKTEKVCLFLLKRFTKQNCKLSIMTILLYSFRFVIKIIKNIQMITIHNYILYWLMANQIVNLAKKSHDVLQLRTTVYFK